MKKLYILVSFVVLVVFSFNIGCKEEKRRTSHVKKLELNRETIAVGIYKTSNPDPVNIKNIIEALKIDGGIVAVTLTNEDILRAELENIDVLIFPGLNMDELTDSANANVVAVIRKFAAERGKGTIGICGGSSIFTIIENESKTVDLIGVESIKRVESGITPGIIKFSVNENGKGIFPELIDSTNCFIDYHGDLIFEMNGTTTSELKNIAQYTDESKSLPLFITLNLGNGRAFLTAVHPESTPGMRWMLPRMVRWVLGRDLISYSKDVVRLDYFKNEIEYNKEYINHYDFLIRQLDEKRKKDRLQALDELQEKYPWFAAEKVKQLLNDKSFDIRIRASRYLSDIGYTMAIDDLESRIQKEWSRKNRRQLRKYLNNLEIMVAQDPTLE